MSMLSVDIGTTGTKSVLFTETGEILNSSYQEYFHYYPRTGWAELNAEKIWEAVRKTVRNTANNHKKNIKVLCLSCMGHNIVPVNRNGTAIRNGILNFDTRTTEEVDMIVNKIGESAHFQIRGCLPRTREGLTKILWLKRNEPETYSQTWKFMTFADFVLTRMGFPAVINYSMASCSLPFDLKKKCYSEMLLQEFGLNREMFSEPIPSDQVLGEMSFEVCGELGLPRGIKVVAGGNDQPCGILGAGITQLNPRLLADSNGTVEVVAYIRAEPILNQQAFEAKLTCYYNILPDTYVIGLSLPTSGSLVRWFRNELATGERMKALNESTNAYDVMFAPVEFGGGTIMVVPHFSGRSIDPYAKGAFLGLTPGTSRAEILQGIVEGTTHELKVMVDQLEDLSNTSVEVIRAFGGPTRSSKWLQLKADMTNKTVEVVQVEEASALGAAIMAGTAVGIYSSIEQAVKATVKIKATYWPRPEIHQIYKRQHKIYRRLVEMLGQVNKELYYM